MASYLINRVCAFALFLCLACSVLVHGTYAATLNPVLEQQRQEEREAVQRRTLQNSTDVRLQSATGATGIALPLGETPCFPIHRIDMPMPQAELDDVLHKAMNRIQPSPLGQCLGAKGINAIVTQIQNELIQRGLVTSRVLVPAQDLNAGVLTLSFIAGRIATIRLQAGHGTYAQELHTALPMQEGDVLNLRDLEQALENLKRVPTAEADIQIEPASEPGFSNLVVTYQQKLPVRLTVSADDGGTRATGRYVGSATLSLDNILGLNDLFYITRTKSLGNSDPGPRGTHADGLHYSFPVGYWTFAANTNSSRYYQQVAGLNAPYIYSGTAQSNDLKLTRLVWRDSQQKHTLGIRAWQRKSNNYIDDTEVQAQRRVVGGWEASLNHKAVFSSNTYEANLAYKRGTGAFGALPSPEDAFGEGTSRFKLISADVSAKLPFDWVGQKWNFASALRGQLNRTPLTLQDRFSIGGRYTVRGFDGESILSAERGWLWRNDLGVAIAASVHEAYIGLDQGRVTGPTSDLLVGRYLMGAVIGVRGAIQSARYDFFVGSPIKKPEDFKTSSVTAGFSLTLSLQAD